NYGASVDNRCYFFFETWSAIIKALYALAIRPYLESDVKERTSLASPATTTFVDRGTPDLTIISFTSAALKSGYCERIKATIPATPGEAIEVPPLVSYSFLGVVEYTLPPGAKTSTFTFP